MEKSPNWSLADEQLTQNLLYHPEQSVDLALQHEETMMQSEQYRLMAQHDPYKAAVWLVRHLRKPLYGAMISHSFHNVMHHVVPMLEGDDQLLGIVDEAPAYPLAEHQTSDIDSITDSAATAYLFSMHKYLDKGWEKVFADSRISGHPCQQLMEALEPVQALHCFLKPNARNAEQLCINLAKDNALVTLELLTRVRVHYADECIEQHRVPTVQDLTRRALQSADRLSWGTTANKTTVAMPLHSSRLSEHFADVVEYDPTEPQDDIVAKRTNLTCPHIDSGQYGFAHPSLVDGPWKRPTFCPASPMIIMRDEKDRDIARRFLNYCFRNQQFEPKYAQDRRGMAQDLAAINLGEFIIQFGILIARQTIFKDWPNIDAYKDNVRNGPPRLSILA